MEYTPDPQPISQIDAVAAHNDLNAGALTIHCSVVQDSTLVTFPKIPIIHVDPTGRPDVADLPRVIGSEGVIGQGTVGWRFVVFPDGAGGVMDCEITRPVECDFKISVSTLEHEELLNQLVDCGVVAFSTQWPCPGTEHIPNDVRFIVTISHTRVLRHVLGRPEQ